MLHVKLNLEATRFIATGGAPQGGCQVHRTVSSWPGWKRLPHTAGNGTGSMFTGPCSAVSALALCNTTFRIVWDQPAHIKALELAARVENARALLNGTRLCSIDRPGRQPMPHQVRAALAIVELKGRVLLADDMGLGKSFTSLLALNELAMEDQWDNCLILCPASVMFNWHREVQLAFGDDEACAVIDGTASKRGLQLQALLSSNHVRFAVINYDLLQHLKPDQQEALAGWVKDGAIIMDESHMLKNHAAQRTKIVRKLFCPHDGGANIRLALTGTPVRNTIEDLYSQVELIQPGTFASYHAFRNEYCVMSEMHLSGRGGRKRKVVVVRGAKNVDKLNTILNTMQVRRKKEEVLNLPPKLHTWPELVLDPGTKKVYEAMRDFALVELHKLEPGGDVFQVKAKTAVEAAARCEQIAQGCLGGIPEQVMPKITSELAKQAEKVRGKPGWLVFPNSPKIKWACDTIEAILAQGGQPIVYSRFNAPLLWLAHKYADQRAVSITGEDPVPKRQIMLDAFAEGDIKVICMQVRIAEGMNLTSSQDELFLGRDWSPAANAQAEDRAHRIGQKGTVNIQIPVVRGTIEVKMHRALEEKRKTAEGALVFKTIGDLIEALSP